MDAKKFVESLSLAELEGLERVVPDEIKRRTGDFASRTAGIQGFDDEIDDLMARHTTRVGDQIIVDTLAADTDPDIKR